MLTIALLIGLAAPLLVTQSPVLAAGTNIFKSCSGGTAATTDYCKNIAGATKENPAVHIIKIIIVLVSYIAGAAAIIGLIVSSLKLILSNGDSAGITSARNGILYSVIGIVVIVLAQVLVVYVLDKVK